MKKRGRIFFVVVEKLTIIVMVVAVFVLAYFSYSLMSPESGLNQRFFGKEAKFQGIIRLWNVDTFEGGYKPRASFLEDVAMRFEKEFKGALIKVENLSVDEMRANIEKGVFPDMFSFGTGLGGQLKERMVELSGGLETGLMSNFFQAGLDGGRLLAAPWSFGGYALISTTKKMAAAGAEGKELKSSALEMAYDVKLKKTTRHVYSLTFGKNRYVDALNIFSREFGEGINSLTLSGAVDGKYNIQTPYEAYLNFVSNKSSALIGTQRDIIRMQSRVDSGAEDDLIVWPLAEYTDLCSFISILKGDKDIVSVCADFVEFLLSEETQGRLGEIGMFSPRGIKLYSGGALSLLENAINEKTIVQSVF